MRKCCLFVTGTVSGSVYTVTLWMSLSNECFVRQIVIWGPLTTSAPFCLSAHRGLFSLLLCSMTDCHSGNQMFDLKDNHNKSVNSKCSSLLVIQYSQFNFICILPNHSKSCLNALCIQNRSRLETPTHGRLHQSCNCITQPVMDNQGCKADPAVQPTN